jgi:hypothetical protein
MFIIIGSLYCVLGQFRNGAAGGLYFYVSMYGK